MTRYVSIGVGLAMLLLPASALAFPFGGQIQRIVPCYNQAIYAYLSAPIGGPYIWTPSTKTYQFGPPSFVGQWLLGLASAPYYCLVSIQPIVVWSGTAISMMGSSGSTAPGATYLQNGQAGFQAQSPTQQVNQLLCSGASGGGTNCGRSSSGGDVVINEVFYRVDTAHGAEPDNQWIELYNGSSAAVDLSGWRIGSASGMRMLPAGTRLAAGAYLVVSDAPSTMQVWSIPSAQFVALGMSLNEGNTESGGLLRLTDAADRQVDAVSWGSNTNAFSPAAPAVAVGHSLVRATAGRDTNAAADWRDSTAPTPGR